MEAYPDAKVLLSVRSPESWAKSMRNTIWDCLYGESLVFHMTQARRYVDPLWDTCIGMLDEMWFKSGLLNGKETTDQWMIDAFNKHTEEVKATVPADRLLVWSPADGWGPLCELLDLPVPDAPLPNVNDTATFGLRLVDGALAAVQAHREADAVPA